MKYIITVRDTFDDREYTGEFFAEHSNAARFAALEAYAHELDTNPEALEITKVLAEDNIGEAVEMDIKKMLTQLELIKDAIYIAVNHMNHRDGSRLSFAVDRIELAEEIIKDFVKEGDL